MTDTLCDPWLKGLPSSNPLGPQTIVMTGWVTRMTTIKRMVWESRSLVLCIRLVQRESLHFLHGESTNMRKGWRRRCASWHWDDRKYMYTQQLSRVDFCPVTPSLASIMNGNREASSCPSLGNV